MQEQRHLIPPAVSLYNSLDIPDKSFEHCFELVSQTKTPLYYYGNRSCNIKHAQLRVKCSKLNYHLFRNHILVSSVCSCSSDCEM